MTIPELGSATGDEAGDHIVAILIAGPDVKMQPVVLPRGRRRTGCWFSKVTLADHDEDDRRRGGPAPNLISQVGRLLLPRADLDLILLDAHHGITQRRAPEGRQGPGVPAIDHDLRQPQCHEHPPIGLARWREWAGVEHGGDDASGVGQVGQHDRGPGGGQLGRRVAPRGDRDDRGPALPGRLDVERGVADEDDLRRRLVASQERGPSDLHQIGPDDVVITECRELQVEPVEKPESLELDQGQRAEVTGEHRLGDPGLGGQSIDRGESPGQVTAAAGPHLGSVCLREHPDRLAQRLEVGHVVPVGGEQIEQDGAVGAAGHRDIGEQRSLANLLVRLGGHAATEPGHVHQRAIDVPENQSRHRDMVRSCNPTPCCPAGRDLIEQVSPHETPRLHRGTRRLRGGGRKGPAMSIAVDRDSSATNPDGRFPVVLRGYDRMQVDDYIARLQAAVHQSQLARAEAEERLNQAQQRLNQSQRALAEAQQSLSDQDKVLEESKRPTLSGLGTRVEQILRLAEEETSQNRAAAQREAEGIVSAARLEARDITERARAEAEAMRAAASRDADNMRAAAQQEAAETVGQAQREADAMRSAADRDTSTLRTTTAHQVAEIRATAEREVAALRATAEREITQLLAKASRDTEEQRAEATRLTTEAKDRREKELQALALELAERREKAEREEAARHAAAVAEANRMVADAEHRAAAAAEHLRDTERAAENRRLESERIAKETIDKANALAEKTLLDAQTEAQRMVHDARTDAELSTSQLRREVEDLNRQRDAVTTQLGSMLSGLSGIVPGKPAS
jgi:cell division septum initiation protein DivIVA